MPSTRLVPGPPGTAVDGTWVHYPPGNTGPAARWDTDGAVYSASGWIDIWAGGSGRSVSGVLSGLTTGQEIAEVNGTPNLLVVPDQADGQWTIQVRSGSESGTVLASAPWDDTGQRLTLGWDGTTVYIQSGSMDYQVARDMTDQAMFFCYPDGTVRLRDVDVTDTPGVWPLTPPAAVTITGITLQDMPGTAPALVVESITLDGPEPASPTPAALTVESITLDGPAALTAAPDPTNPADVGPGEQVDLGAVLTSGGTADAWHWRRISGPAVSLLADGPRCRLVGPSIMPPSPQLLVLGVRATAGTQTSPETQVTIRVLPQISWTRHGTTTAGRRVAPAHREESS